MACRTSFLKAVLIALNVLLSLIGVTLIALSVYELNSSTPGTFEHIAIVVQIFVGTFVVLTSFLGCFASARVSLGLVWSYVICLLILLCLQIYIIAAAHSTDYVERSRKDFLASWADQRDSVERIALLEQRYSCCGQSGARDYVLMGRGIPLSCYRAQERRENSLFAAGCLQAVQAHATDNVTIGLIIKWLLLLVEIVGILAALAGVYELDQFSEGSAEHVEKFIQLGMAGALILAGLVGCLGAIFGSIKVMVVNLVVLLVLIVLHIWKVSHYNETKQLDATEVYVMDLWMKELVHQGAMQDLQQKYECCGDKGVSDYTSLNMKEPRSCFHTKDGIHALYPYAEGCMAAVKRAYLQMYRYEKWVHCGLIGYEVVGIILGITLCCQLTNKTRLYTY